MPKGDEDMLEKIRLIQAFLQDPKNQNMEWKKAWAKLRLMTGFRLDTIKDILSSFVDAGSLADLTYVKWIGETKPTEGLGEIFG